MKSVVGQAAGDDFSSYSLIGFFLGWLVGFDCSIRSGTTRLFELPTLCWLAIGAVSVFLAGSGIGWILAAWEVAGHILSRGIECRSAWVIAAEGQSFGAENRYKRWCPFLFR